MTRLLTAIDGIDGSGKTRFAARLLERCQIRGLGAELLRIDDFRRVVDWERAGDREADLYYNDYYDFAAAERCLRQYLDGATELEIPSFDSVVEVTTGSRRLPLTGIDLLVVEGVFPLRVPAIARGTLIYLATSYAEARRRIIARDTQKSRTVAEVERRIDRRYFPSQKRYHHDHDPRACAALIIDNENPAHPRVLPPTTLALLPQAYSGVVAEVLAS